MWRGSVTSDWIESKSGDGQLLWEWVWVWQRNVALFFFFRVWYSCPLVDSHNKGVTHQSIRSML